MTIKVPTCCTQEVSYVIDCLFSEFLGLSYTIVFDDDTTDVVIVINGRKIRIKNCFFAFLPDAQRYGKERLPKQVVTTDFLVSGMKFPISCIYGDPELVEDNGDFRLDCDIIGSTFFMLSRWEEYANKERDAHGRFPATSSVAYKHGFLDRPVVNEYVELLWALLTAIGCKQERKKYTYKMVPTHDVDRPYLFNSTLKNIRMYGGYLKRRQLREFGAACTYGLSGIDPWDTHDRFMDLSEEANTESYFFFLPKGKDRHDGRYDVMDKRIKSLYKRIIERGHHIGFHPSYNTYNDPALFKKEKQELEEAVGMEMNFGRQHYLRFEVPTTFQIWNDCQMEWDSTMSYADVAGFRCGVCYPFPVFDIESRKRLGLYERPLILMEGSLVGYEGLTIGPAIERIRKLRAEVKKYNGEFVFLYHNSSFFEGAYRGLGMRLLECMYA